LQQRPRQSARPCGREVHAGREVDHDGLAVEDLGADVGGVDDDFAVAHSAPTVQVAPECSRSFRSPGPERSWAAAICWVASVAYSGRSTARNTPTGVGSWGPEASRERVKASEGS